MIAKVNFACSKNYFVFKLEKNNIKLVWFLTKKKNNKLKLGIRD